jgi:formylglycine-generating enzyme required for sulfatase activity
LYSFPYRTFREYLAGCYLIRQRNHAREIYARAGEGDYWAVAVQLAAEELLHNIGQRNDLLDLIYHLCPTGCEPATAQTRWAALWAGSMAVLPGPDIIERDTAAPGGGPMYLKHLRAVQTALLSSDLPALERAEAGRNLARLGDPRPGVGVRPDNGLSDIVWCEIPAGPFVMGSDKSKDKQADDNELPQRSLDLPVFRISQYLITNAQYRTFVDAGGYGQADYWPVAIQAGYWREGQVKRVVYRFEGGDIKTEEEWAEKPADFGPKFRFDNQPVVGVNWYEAIAYCLWLTTQLRHLGELGVDEIVLLPTEAQWEKAARGADGRIYPWGNNLDPNLANCHETGLRVTSAVGCFPGGASSYGCLDMAGNVWEWTSSLFKKYPYSSTDGRENLEASNEGLRVLRGGAWLGGQRYARCAFRLRFGPYNGHFDFGFRIVVSPISPASAL